MNTGIRSREDVEEHWAYFYTASAYMIF